MNALAKLCACALDAAAKLKAKKNANLAFFMCKLSLALASDFSYKCDKTNKSSGICVSNGDSPCNAILKILIFHLLVAKQRQNLLNDASYIIKGIYPRCEKGSFIFLR